MRINNPNFNARYFERTTISFNGLCTLRTRADRYKTLSRENGNVANILINNIFKTAD